MCTTYVQCLRAEQGVVSLGAGITDYCERPCGCWELNRVSGDLNPSSGVHGHTYTHTYIQNTHIHRYVYLNKKENKSLKNVKYLVHMANKILK